MGELSNGNGDDWHADYVMGWDENFLQEIMDDCYTEKDIPCGSTRLRDIYGEVSMIQRPEIVRSLQSARVPMANTSCNTEESVDKIGMLPRGGCVGDVLSTDICEQPGLPVELLVKEDMQKDETKDATYMKDMKKDKTKDATYAKDTQKDETTSSVTVATLGSSFVLLLSSIFVTAMY